MTLLRWRWRPQRPHHRALLDHMSQYVTRNLKNRAHTILRLWTDHCEYIAAQRCRRAQQMACLYTRLWEERALRELMRRIRKQVQRHTKGLMLGAVALHQTAAASGSGAGASSAVTFDWEAERISYDAMRPHLDEIEFVRKLQQATIVCGVCRRRTLIDARIDGIEYCTCGGNKAKKPTVVTNAAKTTTDKVMNFSEWIPYLERENMVVWRREERPGLFAYKVHASYSDISAEDFLYVQTDTQYRKVWDKTAISLDIVDVDPANRSKSQVVYWEMLWPKLFANRDYVYRRRIIVDRQRRTIVIASQSIQHPCCPPQPSKQRVQDYWSYMVIRPTGGSFRRPGLEYVLTYFDNPGVVVPPAITSWVAQKQMPDFLNKLHMATVEYAGQRQTNTADSHGPFVDDEDYDDDLDDERRLAVAGGCWDDDVPDPGFEFGDVMLRYGHFMRTCGKAGGRRRRSAADDDDDEDDDDRGRNGPRGGGSRAKRTIEQVDLLEDTDTPVVVPRKTSWWSYLWPYYYFAST